MAFALALCPHDMCCMSRCFSRHPNTQSAFMLPVLSAAYGINVHLNILMYIPPRVPDSGPP